MQRYLDLQDREAHEGLRIKWTQVPKKLDYRVKIAVSWLLDIQDPAGCWDSRGPWLTAAVIKTLLIAKPKVQEFERQIDSAIKNGISWLVSDEVIGRQPHGGFAWDPNLGTWDTAVILRVLIGVNHSDPSVLNGVKGWLIDQVGRTYFGSTTVPFGESYPAQTLLALEESGEVIYSKGVGQNFRDKQYQDGSWGDHFNTAEVLQYLARHKEDNEDAIAKSITYIERTQSANGTWGSLTWPTALTLMAYLELARNPYTITTIRALEYLSGQQHINGSWFHLLADTAFATEALLVAINKLDFARFSFVTGSDFKMSSVTVVPEDAMTNLIARRNTIQIDQRMFNILRIGLGIVAVSLLYTIVATLGRGWSTLDLGQRFELIIKVLGAIIASSISGFAPFLVKKMSRPASRKERIS